MAYSSLADELANAIEDQDQSASISKSLAAEFGLDFDVEGREEGVDNDAAAEEPTDLPPIPITLPARSPLSAKVLNRPSRLPTRKKSALSLSTSPVRSTSLLSPSLSPDRSLHAQLPASPNIAPQSLFRPVEKPPLAVLSESITSISALLSALGTALPDEGASGGIEDHLQGYLGRMHDAERDRDEGLRELVVLTRELGSLAYGEGIEFEDLLDNEEDEHDEEEYDGGWVGDPAIPAEHEIPPLPSTLGVLHNDTAAVLSSLAHLSESLFLSSSLQTSTSRQLRGIRSGIEGWRERENQEETSRRLVEEYEQKKDSAGAEEGLEHGLRREMSEFERVLNDWGRRMGEMRNNVRVQVG